METGAVALRNQRNRAECCLVRQGGNVGCRRGRWKRKPKEKLLDAIETRLAGLSTPLAGHTPRRLLAGSLRPPRGKLAGSKRARSRITPGAWEPLPGLGCGWGVGRVCAGCVAAGGVGMSVVMV